MMSTTESHTPATTEYVDDAFLVAMKTNGLDMGPWLHACDAGWQSDRIDAIFQRGRTYARHNNEQRKIGADPRNTRYFRYAREIFDALVPVFRQRMHPFTFDSCPIRFLDLGFAPGGMSCEMLRRFPRATGVGLTLRDGFSRFSEIDEYVRSNRYQYWFTNLEHSDWLAELPPKGREVFERNATPFDFVIDDTALMKPTTDDDERPRVLAFRKTMIDRTLSSLTSGAMYLCRERIRCDDTTLIRLAQLHERFEGWVAIKPSAMFSLSCTYYLLCYGFREVVTAADSEKATATFYSDLAHMWKPVIAAHTSALETAVNGRRG